MHVKQIAIALIIGGMLVCSSSSCNQFENLTKFTINYEQTATVKSSVGINLPFNIATPEMETNAEEEFENENTNKKYVRSIFLKSLSLELNQPPGEDFSFLQEITVFINSAGLEEVIAAELKPVPESASNMLELECTDEDLQEYIKAEKFSLRLKVVTDEILSRDHKFTIRSSFDVSAQLNNNGK